VISRMLKDLAAFSARGPLPAVATKQHAPTMDDDDDDNIDEAVAPAPAVTPTAQKEATMTDQEFQAAVLHMLHVQVISAKESAAYRFGRNERVVARLNALAQLCLALHDGDANEAKQRLAQFLKEKA
jgi:hypothetical protein